MEPELRIKLQWLPSGPKKQRFTISLVGWNIEACFYGWSNATNLLNQGTLVSCRVARKVPRLIQARCWRD